MINISKLDVMVYRFPLAIPVQTSFGLMQDRPMVLVKLTTDDGIVGWGEIWCNFPNVGAEHRAHLTRDVFAPLVLSKNHATPEAAFDFLTKATWVLGLQTGETGPLAQCIAGIEIALSDIYGKQKAMPLWKLYGGKSGNVPVYASGINPTNPTDIASKALELGYCGLKLKIGFGQKRDCENLAALRHLAGDKICLMADANQAWQLDEALVMSDALAEFDLDWLEEPIATDRPLQEWKSLKKAASMPIAAGENISGEQDFDIVINDNILTVIQPDLAKWGGLSKTIPIAKNIIAAGKRYCPHYLGGGIGLVASAHALAAVGGDGILEVDINPNPLRTNLVGDMLTLVPGMASLGSLPGLGYEPDLATLKKYQVL
jgi:L-alanine-DL-glutamate epimerase-like enolase superfamily enzyme